MKGGKKEYVDLIRDARQFIENKALRLPYRAVIVDEAQDLSAEAFRLLRTIVPAGENDLFIVEDANGFITTEWRSGNAESTSRAAARSSRSTTALPTRSAVSPFGFWRGVR
jgi:superfamily I DNA/RNA helicase